MPSALLVDLWPLELAGDNLEHVVDNLRCNQRRLQDPG